MKKLTAWILALALVLGMSLSGCGPSKRAIERASSSSDLNLTAEQIEKLAEKD